MFGKRICIYSEEAAIKFYHHLLKKLSNGGLVKHLFVYITAWKPPLNKACFTQLLPLVFTPRLEGLDADCISNASYQAIIDIAQQTPSKFNIITLPIPGSWRHDDEASSWELYKKAVLLFKNTLEHLEFPRLTIDKDVEFVRLLGQFK